MSDNYAASITFPAKALEIKAVEKAYVEELTFMDVTTSRVYDHGIEMVEVENPLAGNGEFDSLENILTENNVPFDRWSDAASGNDQENVSFRSGSGLIEVCDPGNVPVDELRELITKHGDLIPASVIQSIIDRNIGAGIEPLENAAQKYISSLGVPA